MRQWVIEFNAGHVADRLRELGRVMGGSNVADAVRELNRLVGIRNVCGIAVTEAMLAPMAAKSMEDGCRLLNLRTCTEQDMLKLYRQAF